MICGLKRHFSIYLHGVSAHAIDYLPSSLCIIYLMVAIGNWLSVSIVAVIGPKLSLIVGGALYV